MKTTISIPDVLFTAADALAGQLGVSRSQLYAAAIAEYVAQHDVRDVTERLNAVYASEAGGLDPVVGELQARSIASPWPGCPSG